MRLLEEELKNACNYYGNIIYCFEISMQDFTKLFLTSSDKVIRSDAIAFLPNSGLRLKEAEFNDSAQNYFILEGIYESCGITKEMGLTS